MSTTLKTVGKLKYDPKKILGRGSFGTVFSGFHVYSIGSIFRPAKSNPVAVKRVERGSIKKDDLQKEEELMKKARNHPNILNHIHTEMNKDFLFVATELCIATLDDYILGDNYQGPSFSNEKEILRQVTKGLDHLHTLQIVHRDIKPNNILIFVSPHEGTELAKPQIKLADFDISRLLKRDRIDFTNTSHTNPRGSRGWMAPEVYESNRFDFKVDVWALGLIFGYALSGGRHPYGDDQDLRTARIKQNEPMLLTRTDLMEVYRNGGEFELIESMLKMEAKDRPMVTDVLKDPFLLEDEVRTAQFLDLCKSFRDSITDEKIIQFKKLVKDETHINATTMMEFGGEMSPLHLVLLYYKNDDLIELVKELLLNGADVNSRTKYVKKIFGADMTPFHFLLCFYKNRKTIDIVQLMLENGSDANAKDVFGMNALHLLCIFYDKENLKDIARMLIENGAAVNDKDEYGRTPLQYLCRFYMEEIEMNERDKRGLKSLVLYFMEKGADINAKDEKGETPAVILRNRDVDVEIL